jgi:hypothetical protein
VTVCPSSDAVTPSGMVTGFLPMRDIVFSPVLQALIQEHSIAFNLY